MRNIKKICVDYEALHEASWGKGKELADYLGCHKMTFSRKITGQFIIRISEINKIAEYLGVNADEFIYFSNRG